MTEHAPSNRTHAAATGPARAFAAAREPLISADWFVRPDGSDHADGIHGVGHTRRVWLHAQEIAAALGLTDWHREVLYYAALWHDIGRTNDGADYYHGAKSAGKVAGLGLHRGVDPEVVESALFIVTHHCGSEEHAERAVRGVGRSAETWEAFRALKDADALDRVRIHDLDVRMLRFEVSSTRVQRAWELLRRDRDPCPEV